MGLKNIKRMLRNNAKKDKPPLEDEELLDIGELVLAAESNALKKQCLALKKEGKRKEKSRYSYSYNFPQQSATTQVNNIIKVIYYKKEKSYKIHSDERNFRCDFA